MPSSTRVLGAAFGGAVLGALIFGLLSPLVYSFFYPGGVQRLGDQMIPIIIIALSIGGLIGAAAGAAWALPGSIFRPGPD
jgi:hypothetical protein